MQNTSIIWGNLAVPRGTASATSKRAVVAMVLKMVERNYQRFSASLPGAIMAHDRPHFIQSVDLSRNGCRIQNTVPLVPGMIIDVFLVPPGEVKPIVIHAAAVRWTGVEGIGIEFQAVAPYHRDRLDLVINQLKKPRTSGYSCPR